MNMLLIGLVSMIITTSCSAAQLVMARPVDKAAQALMKRIEAVQKKYAANSHRCAIVPEVQANAIKVCIVKNNPSGQTWVGSAVFCLPFGPDAQETVHRVSICLNRTVKENPEAAKKERSFLSKTAYSVLRNLNYFYDPYDKSTGG